MNRILSGRIAAPGGLACALLLAACARAPVDFAADGPQVQGTTIAFAADSPQREVLGSERVEPAAAATLTLPGRVEWDPTHSSALHAPLPGQIASLEVEPGQKVKAGQVIAWIDSAEFGQAQAEGARGRAELRQARSELTRMRELQQAGVASSRELEEAESAFAASQAEHARSVAFARSHGNGDRVDQRLPLRSPIDGVLVERRMSPGMHVSPDAERPLAVVGDPDRLWLVLDAAEGVAGQLQPGQAVTVEAGLGEAAQATLTYVDDYVDSERRVVQARARLDNSARRFKAGQYVRAAVAVPAQGGVIVPASAVLVIEGRQVVFIDQGQGRYQQLQVQTRELGDGRLWIQKDLAEDSRVVTRGGLLLQQLLDTAPATTAAAATDTDTDTDTAKAAS
ncbi:efflux RND transporter periplasmic adaptor subunit [Stenotrophomonas sp. C3(2023)]|uniref:efflux RND transporter periplasmic adaptor subunit n=1 Tax=Stenotrophomonas sp. C3(2023) TaxID=3080277 RepID=UPI00293CBF5A|nr:efflux RND transporter periplasmic adaptor subunit [Stenotrophomonas sp. C3(2023)]MDV3468718.1 efflux RND transporter periplasmic adaptor subunit [Stenotrophomonas sp. C3(2023)]